MPELREKEDQNVWNFLFSVVFVGLVTLSLWNMQRVFGALPTDISVFDAILIVLAVFRLTRLFVYDKVTRFVREWFVQNRLVLTETGAMIETTPFKKGFRRAISEILACPWCTGAWLSLPVVYCYFMYAWSWYVIFVLAVAGMATCVQILVNLVGWQAELSKMAIGEHDNKCE